MKYRWIKYRYISNDRKEDYLKDDIRGRLYLPKWNELNDPMEGVFRYYKESEFSPVNEIVKKIVSEKSNYRIKSFQHNYKNFPMWSYYANGHMGVCIGYELSNLQFDDTISFHNMTYADKLELITKDNTNIELSVEKILTTKLKCWERERECRLLSKKSDIYMDFPVKQIIFGMKCDRHFKEYVKCKAVEYNGFSDIEFRQAAVALSSDDRPIIKAKRVSGLLASYKE